jgi:hypothetical protein
MTYAQLTNGVVVNTIQLDDPSLLYLFAVGYDGIPIRIDLLAVQPNIGWVYDISAQVFYPPYGVSINTINTQISQMTPSSGNAATCIVDFGFDTGLEGDTATITVPATWVLSTTVLVCTVAAISTLNHDPEDAVVEGIIAYPTNIVPGVSFDVECSAANNSWGQYQVNIIGV